MFSVKILLDSVNPLGKRLTTYLLTYPRFIHPQVLNHRVLSRSSSSNRAVPISKLIEQVDTNPAFPIHWGKNQPGMQANEEIDSVSKSLAKATWLKAAKNAIASAKELYLLGVHKQVVNRVLEPYMYITVVLSGTEWDNYFRLRAHDKAQPEHQQLASEMQRLYIGNEPVEYTDLHWHLPFITQEDRDTVRDIEKLKQISVARIARTSYLNHEGKRDYNKDIELCERLKASDEWGPFEHVAQAMNKSRSGNFIGWYQYREDLDKHFLK